MTQPTPNQIPDWISQVGKGWAPLLRDLHEKLSKLDPGYRVSQVKEKFGSLRVYAVGGSNMVNSDLFQQMINEAERQSETVCENCGAPGEILPTPGWYLCLCDDCRNVALNAYQSLRTDQ